MAAKNFIQINVGTRLGQQARNAIDQLRGARDQLQKIKDVIVQQAIDDGTYAITESQFGLQTGDGQAFYNLVAGVVADLAAANETNLLSRCG